MRTPEVLGRLGQRGTLVENAKEGDELPEAPAEEEEDDDEVGLGCGRSIVCQNRFCIQQNASESWPPVSNCPKLCAGFISLIHVK